MHISIVLLLVSSPASLAFIPAPVRPRVQIQACYTCKRAASISMAAHSRREFAAAIVTAAAAAAAANVPSSFAVEGNNLVLPASLTLKQYTDSRGYFSIKVPPNFVTAERDGSDAKKGVLFVGGDYTKAEVLSVSTLTTVKLLSDAGKRACTAFSRFKHIILVNHAYRSGKVNQPVRSSLRMPLLADMYASTGYTASGDLTSWAGLGQPLPVARLLTFRRDQDAAQSAAQDSEVLQDTVAVNGNALSFMVSLDALACAMCLAAATDRCPC
jgi:hypothetical protein